jgi:ABC-2 type transport system ATP-binding protein
MPELDSYVSGLDAVELCTFAGELCGLPAAESRERAHAVLAFVGLEDKRYLKVHTYSTGQKQRVKLAQALVHDPEVLLLDEPTNGLDPRGRDEMLTLIQQLPMRRKCSIILSSHLLPDVEAVCHDAILLNRGKVLYSGAIAEMHGDQRPAFEVRVKEGTERLAVLLRQAGCEARREQGGLLVQLGADQDTDIIFRQAQEAGAQVRHLAPVQDSLEASFLRILEGTADPAPAPGAGAKSAGGVD